MPKRSYVSAVKRALKDMQVDDGANQPPNVEAPVVGHHFPDLPQVTPYDSIPMPQRQHLFQKHNETLAARNSCNEPDTEYVNAVTAFNNQPAPRPNYALIKKFVEFLNATFARLLPTMAVINDL